MPPKKKEGPASAVPYPLDLPSMKNMAELRKSFRYTSPNTLPKRSAAEKAEHGCIRKFLPVKVKKGPPRSEWKFTGDYCSEWENPDEKDKRKRVCKKGKSLPDPYCKGVSKPCDARASCPVQLIFLRGVPYLRFCQVRGERGYAIPISSPEEGQARAEEACRNWKRLKTWKAIDPKSGKEKKYYEDPPPRFFERNDPKLIEEARKALPASGGLAGPPRAHPLIIPLISALPFALLWFRGRLPSARK
jgi:hypothetical protein